MVNRGPHVKSLAMLPQANTSSFGGERAVPRQSQPPLAPNKPGGTTIRLPLGGVASSDPAKVRAPLVHPFWLLAGMLTGMAVCFLWLRLTLL